MREPFAGQGILPGLAWPHRLGRLQWFSGCWHSFSIAQNQPPHLDPSQTSLPPSLRTNGRLIDLSQILWLADEAKFIQLTQLSNKQHIPFNHATDQSV
jgi:hypothetical protein